MKNFRWIKKGLLVLTFGLCGVNFVSAQSANVTLINPGLDRWMYPNNPFPTNYTKSSAFATSGEENDTRLSQYITGFDTFSQIPTNRGAANYLIRHVRLRFTIRLGNAFVYDPTYDSYTTYLPTNDFRYQPDSDTYGSTARPVELFGAGFRNGFTAETFVQTSDFGGLLPAGRNAFAAGYSTNGAVVDISNNVGKTNAAFAPFEVYPFAIGQTTNAAPGELVPVDSKFTFDLNLDDPLVKQYVQESLDRGRLILTTTGLHRTTQMGTTGFAAFWTHFNLFDEGTNIVYGPVLELEATAIRPADSDGDGLPDDWEQFYFSSLIDPLSQNATDDSDGDGQSNLAEYLAGTNPNASAGKLKISSLNHEAGNSFALQFPFAASRHYVVEYSGDLQNWSSLTNPPLTYYAAPGAAEWRDDGSQTGGLGTNRFYRIRIAP